MEYCVAVLPPNSYLNANLVVSSFDDVDVDGLK